MTPNNNLSVLPWYDSIERQNHRKDYAFGNIYQLITPDRKLLPFQIVRPTRENQITKVLLRKVNGQQFADITAPLKETGLKIKQYSDDGYDIIMYPGNLPMSLMTPEGAYYAEMTDGVQTWYSEVFTVFRTVERYMMIEWWDDEPLYYSGGHIEYDGEKYKNRLYLNAQLARPEYDFTEEGENRDGYFYPEKQVSEKVFKFTFIAPEYLCDAMRIIRMSDHVEITNKGQRYVADSFLITPKWQDQGDLAAVDAEFETDTVIKKLGRSMTRKNLGSFNADYNADFDVN